MNWIVANTMTEYMNFRKRFPEYEVTRYIGQDRELYGVRGEVIIVNDGHFKFDTKAHETLLAYQHYGLIKITRVYF